MDAIEKLKQRLATYPEILYEVGADSITVSPLSESGFAVTLSGQGDELTVYYNGWHAHFTDADEATRCFIFGLSKDCRIQEVHRGGQAHKWTLEIWDGGEWKQGGTVVLLVTKFWKRPSIVTQQNDAVPWDDEARESGPL